MKSLFNAIVKFQAECPRVLKDDKNPHFKSRFSSILAMKEAVQPLLAKHGLAVMQFPIGDGARAGCRTVVLHESGESLEQEFLIPIGEKMDAQKSCAAVSYARRFAFSGALGLVSSEDADKDGEDLIIRKASQAADESKARRKGRKPSDSQRNRNAKARLLAAKTKLGAAFAELNIPRSGLRVEEIEDFADLADQRVRLEELIVKFVMRFGQPEAETVLEMHKPFIVSENIRDAATDLERKLEGR